MRISILLVIIITVFICYGILPILSGFLTRNTWRRFRKKFNELLLCPLLDYSLYRQSNIEGQMFYFTGEIESITDGHTLWVRGDDLTMPVSLELQPNTNEKTDEKGKKIDSASPGSQAAVSPHIKTKCFLLPRHEGNREPDAPVQIRWNLVSTLSEGIKVFIGGQIKKQNNRLIFCSTKDKPLMVIFYSCPDTELSSGIIRAARSRNEYWNSFTPISLAIGAFTLIFIAASYLNRPAFHFTVISAFIAVFIPILPIMPPGFLFTILYRRLTMNARKLRITSDLACFNLLPDISGKSAGQYAVRAYLLEAFAWLFLLTGVIINIIFIYIILTLQGII